MEKYNLWAWVFAIVVIIIVGILLFVFFWCSSVNPTPALSKPKVEYVNDLTQFFVCNASQYLVGSTFSILDSSKKIIAGPWVVPELNPDSCYNFSIAFLLEAGTLTSGTTYNWFCEFQSKNAISSRASGSFTPTV